MKSLITIVFSLCLCQLHAQIMVHKQDSKGKGNGFSGAYASFVKERVGHPFPLDIEMRTINGHSIDFGHIDHPTMVFFGFDGCMPCNHEIPIMMQEAAKNKYSSYHFIYITRDDSATAMQEFSTFKTPGGRKPDIICGANETIRQYKLTYGYPIVYMINPGGIVAYVEGGGFTEGHEDEIVNKWETALDGLKR